MYFFGFLRKSTTSSRSSLGSSIPATSLNRVFTWVASATRARDFPKDIALDWLRAIPRNSQISPPITRKRKRMSGRMATNMFCASRFSTSTIVELLGSFHPSCETVSRDSLYDCNTAPVTVSTNTLLSRTEILLNFPAL